MFGSLSCRFPQWGPLFVRIGLTLCNPRLLASSWKCSHTSRWKLLRVQFVRSVRTRAHWTLCLATGGRVFVADPSTLGRHVGDFTLMFKTLCLWRGRATACRTLEPQTAVCSPKLENNDFLRELISPPQKRGHLWLNKVASVLGP